VNAQADDSGGPAYILTISLNVLNHLGINLYSNVPAVLSEVVANAWDADANHVWIDIDPQRGEIVVTDDGDGMTHGQVNDRFLTVGYQRRAEKGGAKTTSGRSVMGRKGIGKLSLFSIAKSIEVHTVREGEISAFRMNVDDIRAAIAEKERDGDIAAPYHPTPLDPSVVEITEGTRIIVTDLKKGISQAEVAMRKRMARRFSIIGDQYKFDVAVNGSPITIEDRDYFHKLEYMWWYGNDGKAYVAHAKHLKGNWKRRNTFGKFRVTGWIGTVDKAGKLKDEGENLNKITLLVRGKVAQEDLLDEFNEGGLYAKYLIGELSADFLDTDNAEDIATSSRQRIMEDDPRYIALKEFVRGELKHIANEWTDLRNAEGEKRATEIPEIRTWYESLPTTQRKQAKSLFGKINQLTIEDERDRRRLFQHCVLAFESLRYKQNLDAIDQVDAENLSHLVPVFAALDDVEATLYHQIVSERIRIIDTLRAKVDTNALEKVVQDHLFTHLWLLDPGWERATDGAFVESKVTTAFNKIDAKLSKAERDGRFDIVYRKTTGEHVIVELKRAERTVTTTELIEQTWKYQAALQKVLDGLDRSDEPIEIVCVVGKPLKEWKLREERERSTRVLKEAGIRVVLYDRLLDNAYKAYSSYLAKRDEAGRVQRLIEALELDDPFG
jgi:hypothetical protein